MKNYLVTLLLLVALFIVNACSNQTSGITTTGNNGVIVAYVDTPDVSAKIAKLMAEGEDDINLKGYLYDQNDPQTIVDSVDVIDTEIVNFDSLPYGEYAIRVDISGEQGGLYKNIHVESEDIVIVKVEINIYIVQNIYVGLTDDEVQGVLSDFEAAFWERVGDSIIVKTLPELVHDTIYIVTENDTLSSLPIEMSSSSAISSSSNEISSSSSLLLPDSLEIVLGEEQSIDAHFLATNGSFNNYGDYYMHHAALYDASTVIRTAMKINLDDSMNVQHAQKVSIEFTSCAWYAKPGGAEPVTIEIHKILKSWKEGSGTTGDVNNSVIDGITGDERFFGESWSTKGIGVDDVDASSKVYTSVGYTPPEVIGNDFELRTKLRLDLTELFIEWNSEPSSNFGFLIKNINETYSNSEVPHIAGWCSTEENEINLKPRLVIEY